MHPALGELMVAADVVEMRVAGHGDERPLGHQRDMRAQADHPPTGIDQQVTVASAQVAYESNRVGQEVGVRTNLDVLNTQQNVYQTRRDLAQAYFNYLIGVLRLKSAVGTLSEQDIEEINRRLTG